MSEPECSDLISWDLYAFLEEKLDFTRTQYPRTSLTHSRSELPEVTMWLDGRQIWLPKRVHEGEESPKLMPGTDVRLRTSSVHGTLAIGLFPCYCGVPGKPRSTWGFQYHCWGNLSSGLHFRKGHNPHIIYLLLLPTQLFPSECFSVLLLNPCLPTFFSQASLHKNFQCGIFLQLPVTREMPPCTVGAAL